MSKHLLTVNHVSLVNKIVYTSATNFSFSHSFQRERGYNRHLMKIFSKYILTLIIFWITGTLGHSENTTDLAESYPRVLRNYLNLQEMKKHKVVPDVIPVAPAEIAKISYPSGVSVEEGNILTPTKVKDQPTVEWTADPNAFYTLCMTDPDAPSRKNPKFREWHHWLVGNIPGNDVSKGEVLSAYIGSAPPQGSGLHRYVFVIYKQNGKLNFTEKKLPNNSGDGRGGFQIQKIAEKYKLGDPVAGNFYQAEYDDYVPKVYKQLKG